MFNLPPRQWPVGNRGLEASLGHATIAGNVQVETRWRLVTASAEPGPLPHHDREILQLTYRRKRHLGTTTWQALATRLRSQEPRLARSSQGLSLNRAASQAWDSVSVARGPENWT